VFSHVAVFIVFSRHTSGPARDLDHLVWVIFFLRWIHMFEIMFRFACLAVCFYCQALWSYVNVWVLVFILIPTLYLFMCGYLCGAHKYYRIFTMRV